jgi:hypothetical protein
VWAKVGGKDICKDDGAGDYNFQEYMLVKNMMD